MATPIAVVRLWHFQCPECGFGDQEFGVLVREHEVLCEICLEENREIRLRRWAADDDRSTPSAAPPDRRMLEAAD